MTINKLREAVIECGNDFYFDYNGKKSGVESNVKDSIFTFNAWYGEKSKIYDDFEKMINDKFYSEKSIIDLINDGIEIRFF